MPEMPTMGWNAEKMGQIFYYTTWFIKEYQIFIMVGTAVALAFAILSMISNLFDRSRTNDKEEDPFDFW